MDVSTDQISGDQGPMLGAIKVSKPLLYLQLVCFAILNAIWVLPGTIRLRNICLIAGALISLCTIYQARRLFLSQRALPIWCILALFAWVSLHLLFLSHNPALQYAEWTSIWKHSAIGCIFALGLGISLGDMMSNAKKTGAVFSRSSFAIFYLGLLLPSLIYGFKWILGHHAGQWGLEVMGVLGVYADLNFAYVAKTAYVAFCLPAFAAALGLLLYNFRTHHLFSLGSLVCLLTIFLVSWVFDSENIKNGVAYSMGLVLIAASALKGRAVIKLTLMALFMACSFAFLAFHIQHNPSWRSFSADAKLALQTDQYAQWKYNGQQGYPINELGATVSITNYERTAWAKEGIKLIIENPLGYCLVERSFGHLAKEKWPDSLLHQSHSGWIDLTLGIGIPGLLLILSALVMTLYWLARCQGGGESVGPNLYVIALQWILLSLLLMWCTTEISQKVYLDSLLFWIVLGAALNITDPKSEILSSYS